MVSESPTTHWTSLAKFKSTLAWNLPFLAISLVGDPVPPCGSVQLSMTGVPALSSHYPFPLACHQKDLVEPLPLLHSPCGPLITETLQPTKTISVGQHKGKERRQMPPSHCYLHAGKPCPHALSGIQPVYADCPSTSSSNILPSIPEAGPQTMLLPSYTPLDSL